MLVASATKGKEKKKSFSSISAAFFFLCPSFPSFSASPCTVSRVQLLPSVRYRYSSALSGLGLEPGGARAERDGGESVDSNGAADVTDADDADEEVAAAAAETPPAATTEPLTAAVPAAEDAEGEDEGEGVVVVDDAFLFLLVVAVFGAAAFPSSFLALVVEGVASPTLAKHL